jgi:hypothetical protein
MSDALEYYDPDSLIKRNHTPPLEAVKPTYTAADTPPPLVLEDTSESSAGSGRSAGHNRTAAGKRKLGRTRPSQCDAVLIAQTAPNRPDIAAHAGQYALDSASQSEAEEGDSGEEDDDEIGGEPMRDERNGVAAMHHVAADKIDMIRQASEALKLQLRDVDRDVVMIDKPVTPREEDKENDDRSQHDSRPSTATTEHTSPLPRVPLDLKPPPLPLHINTASIRNERTLQGADQDSIPISPNLAKFAIKEGNPDNVLPAMQSPPRASSAHSPEVSGQTLPSLKATLSQMSDTSSNGIYSATGAHSPSMTRPSPGHMSNYGPSPASYHPSPSINGMSPPGIPTHRSYVSWPHPPPREGSQSTATPSEYTSNHSQSTPSSAITVPSPSYPTSISAHQRQNSEGTPQGNCTSPTTNGTGPLATNAFKCTYSGCTAAPFQTQYLLNSHANVHSSSRPHFCPVEHCNRGPGGKGFKRKNEMIR